MAQLVYQVELYHEPEKKSRILLETKPGMSGDMTNNKILARLRIRPRITSRFQNQLYLSRSKKRHPITE